MQKNSILYVFCMYFVYILYVFCIYFVCILLLYFVYILYIFCIYFVYILYIFCIYFVCILYVFCIYFVYIMYIFCIYFACILLYFVYILYVFLAWKYYFDTEIKGVTYLPFLMDDRDRLVFLFHNSRGFNGSVNIPENCNFRSQFVLININIIF